MIDTENTQSRGENMDNVDTLPMDVESVDDYLAKETFTYIYVIYGYVNMIICILPRVLCQKVCYARALHTGSHDGTYGIFFGSTGICKRTGLLENLSCPDLTTPLYKTARCARFSLSPKPQWIQ